MKYKAEMPKDFELLPEGTYKFQITDVAEATKKQPDGTKTLVKDTLMVTCEVIEPEEHIGENKYLRTSVAGEFLWVTKNLLKCIGQPYEGDVVMDTDAWIGKQFFGEVKHKDGFANINKFVYKEIKQPDVPYHVNNPGGITDPNEIKWNN